MSKPNEKLRKARIARGWTQATVAAKVGSEPLTVSRWERGVQPPSFYFQEELCRLFEMTAVELGLLEEEDSSDIKAQKEVKFWYVPYSRNPSFTDHRERVKSLRERFIAQEQGASHQSISGLGGIGKTELALEYSYRYQEEYAAVFWLRAGTQPQLLRDIIDIAHLLQVPATKENEINEQHLVNEVIQWLQMHDGWLLVLDNVEEEFDEKDSLSEEKEIKITSFLSTLKKGHILLTTRSQSIARLAQNVRLEKMTAEEGAQLLLLQTNQHSSSTILEDADATDRQEALALSQFLDGLPLALEQARAYIEVNECGFAGYTQLYEKYRKELLKSLIKNSRLEKEYGVSVATTWLISFERVKHLSVAASDMLKLYAYLAPDAIPEDIVLKGADALNSDLHQLHALAGNELQFTYACRVLLNYSLVKRNAKEKMLSIHRLIQAVLQDSMENEEQRFWAKQAVCAVELVFSTNLSLGEPVDAYIPHVRICAKFIKKFALEGEEAAHLLEKGAHTIYERGWYAQARPLYLRAHAANMNLLGEDDPHTLHLMLDVAKVHMDQGAASFAANIYLHAKEELERIGVYYPDIVTCLNALATAQLKVGSLEEAEQTCKEALAWHGRVAKPDVAQQAATYHIAAQVSASLRVLNRAEAYYQVALKLREQAFGLDHAEVANTLHDLGVFNLFYIGNFSQAETLLQRALKIRLALDPNHPNTANCLVSLGVLCWERKKYIEAEEYYLRAFNIRQQKLGPYHPDLLQCLHDLAQLSADQRKDEEAELYFREAFKLAPDAGGMESHAYLLLLTSYIEFLRERGRRDEAKAYQKQVINLRNRLLTRGQILSQALSDEDGQSTSPAHIWSFER